MNRKEAPQFPTRSAIRSVTNRQVIGPFDLLLAATALANDMTLVTHNTGEFKRVADLRVEGWSVNSV